MLKSYLEYEELRSFGVITSHPSNILFDDTGKLAITAALDRVNIWNIRKGSLETSLGDYSKKAPTIRILRASPDFHLLAAGYSDGSIIIWNLDSRQKETKFNGHKSAVSALRFSFDGSRLVSGSNDTDVIVWDVLAERGLFKLRGHKNMITEVFFLENTKALVSSSKDQLIKVWDMETRHCLQTVVGHAAEVSSFTVNQNETRLISVCADGQVRVYKILQLDEIKEKLRSAQELQVDTKKIDVVKMEETDPFKRLQFWGMLPRKLDSPEKPIKIQFNKTYTTFGIQSQGKTIEFFKVHTAEEYKKKFNRHTKRSKEAAQKKGKTETLEPYVPQPADEFSSEQVYRGTDKILSFDFHPESNSRDVIISLYNNSIILCQRNQKLSNLRSLFESNLAQLNKYAILQCQAIAPTFVFTDLGSAVAFSSRDEMILSTSDIDMKIWNASTANCIKTISTGYGLCGFFAPGDKHVVIGTKAGHIELYDLNTATLLESNTTVHTQSVFSMALNPSKTGFISVSGDKTVAFWEFALIEAKTQYGVVKKLSMECKDTMEVNDGIFSVRYSPDGKFFAVALMDYTVKLYFADTKKFYLSLYGHKLPVMCMDISSDSTLVVTGSADKNVRIWGIDFGDCHRSLFAHDDTITQVAFVPDTHYFFTAAKDGKIKYWDADKFEHIMTLEGHHQEIWGMALSTEGNYIASGGQDRSLRIWHQTDTQLFLEEKREMEMDEAWEKEVEQDWNRDREGKRDDPAETTAATKQSIENIKDAEKVLEALDLVEEARAEDEEYEKELEDAKRTLGPAVFAQMIKEGKTIVAKPTRSVFLLEMEPQDYLLWVIAKINPANLESTLLVLPYTYVLHLLHYLEMWVRANKRLQLCCTMLFFLLKNFQVQLSANRTLRDKLNSIRTHVRQNLQREKDRMTYNLVAMELIKKQIEEEDNTDFFEISSKLAALEKRKKQTPTRQWWEDSDSTEDGSQDDS